MIRLKLDTMFRGNFGELVLEYYAPKRKIAYLGLEDVHNGLYKKHRNSLTFKSGPYRILLEIEKYLVPEIRNISKPNGKYGSGFRFDYLVASLAGFKRDENGLYLPDREIGLKDLNWVEIKFRGGTLSQEQEETMEQTQIPVSVIKVQAKLPESIDIMLDKKGSRINNRLNKKTLFDKFLG